MNKAIVYFCLMIGLFLGIEKSYAIKSFAIVESYNGSVFEGILLLYSSGDYKYELPSIDWSDPESEINNGCEYIKNQIGCNVCYSMLFTRLFARAEPEPNDDRFIIFTILPGERPEKGEIFSAEKITNICEKGKIDVQCIDKLIAIARPWSSLNRH
ncbi:MAG: hypothetical protein LBH49_01260 [Puniceicoccales bacterium]|jgi:hypothetical protein|nr:hypothetical protein [Puniceicoccales bacterium]